MRNTNFTNASGWHDPRQVTTAMDLARLTLAIKRDFPQYYHFFNKTSFIFKNKVIQGHNRVTATYPGAEGLKTGYHTPGGFNLITSATRGNKTLIGVITGKKNSAMRDLQMVEMLDKHFGLKHPTVKKTGKPPLRVVKTNNPKTRVNSVNSRKQSRLQISTNKRKKSTVQAPVKNRSSKS
jgi:D-alanyl-D-alanine carboxypeptidase (penicillin-binding protein 5/6)